MTSCRNFLRNKKMLYAEAQTEYVRQSDQIAYKSKEDYVILYNMT